MEKKKEFEWLTRLARRNKTTFWVLILHHLKNRLAFSTCSTLQLETLCPEPRGKINNKQQRAENRAFLIITQLSHLPRSFNILSSESFIRASWHLTDVAVWWMTTSSSRQDGGVGEKGWEIKRSKGGKAEGRWGEGLCNRWSECSLTAGEYARLPQSDKWLSRSQTAGRKTGGKTVFICSRAVTGRKLLFLKRGREREKCGHGGDDGLKKKKKKNQVFTQHKSTRETVLNTSTHGYETEKTRREGERGKKTKTNKQSLWPKAALSALVFIFGLSSLSLVGWIIHNAGVCRNYSTAVAATAGEPQT